jgi:outer membrane protein assembly factor BamB
MYKISVTFGEITRTFSAKDAIKSSPYCDPHTGNIFFGSHDNHLYCITDDCLLLWKMECTKPLFASPIQDLKVKSLYIGCLDGTFYCIDLKSHLPAVKWQLNLGSPIFSSATVDTNLSTVYVGCCNNDIYCFSSLGEQVSTLVLEVLLEILL